MNNKIIIPIVIEILILLLMILQVFLSNTTFNTAQILSELALMVAGVILVFSLNKVSREDVILLAIFVVIQSISFIINDLYIFLLNFKIYYLAVVFFIIGRNVSFRSYVIDVVAVLSIIMVVLEYFVFEGYPFNVTDFIAHKSFVNSKPIGLFLNYHFTSFFIAVYLIGKSYQYNLFFIDYFILLINGVRTSIYSYFIQQLIFKKNINLFASLTFLKELFLIFVLFLTGMYFLDTILLIISEYDIKFTSLRIIVRQILSYDFILPHLVVFPVDADKYIADYAMDFSDLNLESIGNEISFLSYIMQGGMILFSFYLYLLIKHISIMRIFIFLTLIHYSYFTSPLIIVMMFVSQEKYNIYRRKNSFGKKH
jgi:hypothetical protein